MTRRWRRHCVHLASLGTTEHGAVDGVDEGVRGYHPACKVASVETFHCLLASLDSIKLDIDIASVVIKRKVQDTAVLCLTFLLDVLFEHFVPVWTLLLLLTVEYLALSRKSRQGENLRVGIKHIMKDNTLAGLWNVGRKSLWLGCRGLWTTG